MVLIEIVEKHLKENGYDGLFNDDQCGCAIGKDFMPCDQPSQDCEPGYLQPCDCGEGCGFHIGPTKLNNKENTNDPGNRNR